MTITFLSSTDVSEFVSMLRFNSPGVHIKTVDFEVETNATIEAIEETLFDCGIEDYIY